MDTAVQTPAGYEDDEHAWLLEQAALLAAGHTAQIDREHLSEFLTDMARRDRREVRSRLLVLMTHILKCIAQPERVSRSWMLTILTQQHELQETIRESRSLAAVAAELVPELARSAARAGRHRNPGLHRLGPAKLRPRLRPLIRPRTRAIPGLARRPLIHVP